MKRLKALLKYPEYLLFGCYYHACEIIEFWRVVWRYYRYPRFALADSLIQLKYLFTNSDRICFNYLKRFSTRDVQRWYGETWLSTFSKISKAADINREDHLYELGCGRGRLVFWASEVLGVKATGIDLNPVFIRRAESVRCRIKSHLAHFRCENIMQADLSAATVVYLYGTAFEEEAFPGLTTLLKTTASGTRIITVSWPVTRLVDDGSFSTVKEISGRYLWGKGTIYISVRS
ncbi:SAM-dependent methyltransferase [Spongorhabdus nitratireducens]